MFTSVREFTSSYKFPVGSTFGCSLVNSVWYNTTNILNLYFVITSYIVLTSTVFKIFRQTLDHLYAGILSFHSI